MTTEDSSSVWVEARSPDGSTYYYHSETRETRWTKPDDELIELTTELTTKKDRVEAVCEWYARHEDCAEELCASLEECLNDDIKKALATLYVLDAIFRKRTPAAAILAEECNRSALPSLVVERMARLFKDADDKLRARDAANSAIFLVGIWEKKKCLTHRLLRDLRDKLAPLRYAEATNAVHSPPTLTRQDEESDASPVVVPLISPTRQHQTSSGEELVPKQGATVTGKVVSHKKFGCFVKVSGIKTDGLVPRGKMTQDAKVGTRLTLVVQPVKEKNRWAGAVLQDDDQPFGHVLSTQPYGYFIRCDDGREGLMHKKDTNGKHYQLGERVRIRVTGLGPDRRCKFVPILHAEAPKKHLKVQLPKKGADEAVQEATQQSTTTSSNKRPAEPIEVKSFDQSNAEKKQRKSYVAIED